MKKILLITLILSVLFPGIIWSSTLDLAFEAHQQGDLKKAEQFYQKALDEGENQAIIYFNLGNLYYSQEDVVEAVLHYRKVIELLPTFKESYLNLGRIHYLYGNYSRALETFLAFLKYEPNDSETSMLVADTYKQLRLFFPAFRYYLKVLRNDPFHEEGYIALADLFLEFDDYETALQYVIAGQGNVEYSKWLLQYEADILKKQNRFDDAIAVYRSLLEGIYSTNFNEQERQDFSFKMIDSLLAAEKINFAIFELENIVENHPHDVSGISFLENIYVTYDKHERGVSFFKKFYSLNQERSHIVMRNFLADAYNRNDILLVQSILQFYEEKNIHDELYQAIENELGYR